MIRLILGAALCVLPLCSAEIYYQGDLGNIIGELVMVHSTMLLPDLKAFLVVNRYLKEEASRQLDTLRCTLKNFVEDEYSPVHCTISYSPDRLSAAIIEETKRRNYRRELLDSFDYVYISKDPRIIQAYTTSYEHSKRKTKYAPFFTKNYVCIDFGLERGNLHDQNILTGISWRRLTREMSEMRLFINSDGKNVPTGWFARMVPGLYEKVMHQKGRVDTCILHDFNVNIMQPEILLPKDVHILSRFMPHGTHADWNELKDKKYRYLLLNILAWYGSSDALLNYLDMRLGVQKVALPNWGTFFMSRSRDIISFREKKNNVGPVLTDRYDSPLSTFAQTTLGYIAQLKKESVFVEKDWLFNVKKRIKLWSQAAKFLQSKRLIFIPQDNHLMRYDSLSQSVTVFSILKDETVRLYVQARMVKFPNHINLSSLRLAGEKVTFETEDIRDLVDEVESSDLLVISSEENVEALS